MPVHVNNDPNCDQNFRRAYYDQFQQCINDNQIVSTRLQHHGYGYAPSQPKPQPPRWPAEAAAEDGKEY
ncbi:uncharacterized protein ATNIH1004_005517 [Aspergillus tanneri]|uniref:Uncharacterized protein n=1 Tax=Aspergillus tanneri TaxID=1220188 RepID=A0A5M9MIK7_9EURO|nr:uncharacterized protein ATNIH1004_005517 [Aspergillus tanneri]KAA8646842.1 hypothetical protein ATNIH1004_005517 [Aspergillus tanneri]